MHNNQPSHHTRSFSDEINLYNVSYDIIYASFVVMIKANRRKESTNANLFNTIALFLHNGDIYWFWLSNKHLITNLSWLISKPTILDLQIKE